MEKCALESQEVPTTENVDWSEVNIASATFISCSQHLLCHLSCRLSQQDDYTVSNKTVRMFASFGLLASYLLNG